MAAAWACSATMHAPHPLSLNACDPARPSSIQPGWAPAVVARHLQPARPLCSMPSHTTLPACLPALQRTAAEHAAGAIDIVFRCSGMSAHASRCRCRCRGPQGSVQRCTGYARFAVRPVTSGFTACELQAGCTINAHGCVPAFASLRLPPRRAAK